MEYIKRIIRIDYFRGHMSIIPDRFFPCTQKDFKKLLKLIGQDYENEDELLGELADYFPERLERERKAAGSGEKRIYDGRLQSVSAICRRLERNARQLEEYMSER